jgi:hypothetical protein
LGNTNFHPIKFQSPEATFFSAQVTAKVICCTSAQRRAPATKRPQKASDQRELSRVGNPRDQSLVEMAGKWLGKGKFELF